MLLNSNLDDNFCSANVCWFGHWLLQTEMDEDIVMRDDLIAPAPLSPVQNPLSMLADGAISSSKAGLQGTNVILDESDLVSNLSSAGQAEMGRPNGWNPYGQRRPYNRPVGLVKRHVPYIEKDRIGQGAFGVVHKAVEENNPNKAVAIKRMKSVRQVC